MLAPAKLNVYLHITGRRDDGYHLLDSVVVFTEFGDEVTAQSDDVLRLDIVGEFAEGLSSADNLVIKAAEALKAQYQIEQGAHLRLHKHVPVAAGLGGGSSDAAAALLLLNEMWGIGAPLEELEALAKPLGADVPACLHREAIHMGGIGHEITPLPELKLPKAVLLVNPRQCIATQDVYRHYAKSPEGFRTILTPQERLNIAAQGNDLQASAIALCPSIQEVLDMIDAQPDCQFVRLCGSGATCFGVFESIEKAEQAAACLQAQKPQWWVQPSQLL